MIDGKLSQRCRLDQCWSISHTRCMQISFLGGGSAPANHMHSCWQEVMFQQNTQPLNPPRFNIHIRLYGYDWAVAHISPYIKACTQCTFVHVCILGLCVYNDNRVTTTLIIILFCHHIYIFYAYKTTVYIVFVFVYMWQLQQLLISS